MSALILCWLVLFGLSGLVPDRGDGRDDWLGARAFTAFALLVIAVYLLQIALGVALRPAALAICAVAALGWIRHAAAWRLRRPDWRHPIFVLPVAVLAAATIRGGMAYEPLAFDELHNWLGWMRQAVAFGFVDHPGILNSIVGYPPGWPIILAFPNLLLGGIEEGRSTAMFVLMHAALLGLLYDVVKTALIEGGGRNGPAGLGAWAVVLAALGVEATWKLVPTNLLVEEPQTYCLAACVLLTLAAGRHGVSPVRAGWMTGCAAALGYLIKVSQLAFMGPLLLLWLMPLWNRRGERSAVLWGIFGVLAVPALVWGVWVTKGSVQGCLSDPVAALRGLAGDGASAERAADLWRRFSAAEIDYVRSYKFPLTLAAVLGLAVGSASRRLVLVPLALLAYFTLYFGALYVYHLDCFGDYYFKVLNSIDRFTRVPLRLMHLLGLVLPVLALAPRWAAMTDRPWMVRSAAAFVVLAGLWQVRQIDASLHSVATRWDATPDQVETVRSTRRAAQSLAALTEVRPELGRDVVQVVQGGQGYEYVIGQYYGLGRFRIRPHWSWGPEPTNVWMQETDAEQMKTRLLSASAVWPVAVDSWMRGILAPLVDEGECREHPERFFLVPNPPTERLSCLARPD